MDSLIGERIYRLELEKVECIERCINREKVEKELSEAIYSIYVDPVSLVTDSVYSTASLASEVVLSEQSIGMVSKVNPRQLSNQIDANVFLHAKWYVTDLLEVPLTKVDLRRDVDGAVVPRNVEGVCVPCGQDRQIVYIQGDQSQVISTDLLVHELGHSAELSFSRSIDDAYLFVGHICLSEAVAYYCQCRYLVKYGSVEQRVGLFGAFTYTYLAICLLDYLVRLKKDLSSVDPQEATKDEVFDKFVAVYSQDSTFPTRKIAQLKADHGDIFHLCRDEICPRFGLILAILWLGEPPEKIRSLIALNRIDTKIGTVIKNAGLDLILDGQTVEKAISRFFDKIGSSY